jgi:hypothetical protein
MQTGGYRPTAPVKRALTAWQKSTERLCIKRSELYVSELGRDLQKPNINGSQTGRQGQSSKKKRAHAQMAWPFSRSIASMGSHIALSEDLGD